MAFDGTRSTGSSKVSPRRRRFFLKPLLRSLRKRKKSSAFRRRLRNVLTNAQKTRPPPKVTKVRIPTSEDLIASAGVCLELATGQTVRLFKCAEKWRAHVTETMGRFSRSVVCPVVASGSARMEAALPALMSLPRHQRHRRVRIGRSLQGRVLIHLGGNGLMGGGRDSPDFGALTEKPVTTSLLQRMSENDITSTEALVDVFNNARRPIDKALLRDWAHCYVNWFSRQPIESLTQKLIREYLRLGEIKLDGGANREFLHAWFCSLCNRMRQSPYGEQKFIEAIVGALQSVDKSIFRNDPSLLFKLADDLLSKLDPAATVFTKETYPTHSAVMTALQQTLGAIHHIAPHQLDANSSIGVYSAFTRRISDIAKEAHYYPFRYHARLIETHLHQLKRIGQSSMMLQYGKILLAIQGSIYVFRGLRSMLELDFDVDAFMRGFNTLHEAFAGARFEQRAWHLWIRALTHAALRAALSPNTYKTFGECFDELKRKCAGMRKADDKKAVRFGMIQQLQLLALVGTSREVTERSIAQLIQLAEECKAESEWREDPDIVEALLDALTVVYENTHRRSDVFTAIEILVSIPDRKLRACVQRWLGEETLEEKLAALPEAGLSTDVGGLFSRVRKDVMASAAGSRAAPPTGEYKEMQAMLKKQYQRSQFTKMEPLFEGDSPGHVRSIHCHLMLLQRCKAKEDGATEAGSEVESTEGSDDDEDHLMSYYERQEVVKTPVGKDELFYRRPLDGAKHPVDVNLVLLTGDPGTGKTTLARHLAFLWAKGEWGGAFELVFFLQVRELQAAKYDDSTDRREETLETAIANNCFPRCDKSKYQSLRDQIREALDEPTTLVVLDGLDENNGASEAIVDEAKNAACKRLLLGRPYGIQEDRELADIEVVHMGFSDAHLKETIRADLPEDAAASLLTFISATPVIWTIAHVPVNAHVLCALWRDPRLKEFKKSASGSLATLYRQMVHFTWERYLRKVNHEAVDIVDILDTLGRIAFEGLRQGKILMDDWFVQDQTRTSQVKRMLRESGFLLLQSVGVYYQFPHLTFQEYFAGRYLARLLCNGSQEEKDEVAEFLAQNKYNAQFRVVCNFMMGEVSMTSGAKGAQKMLDLIKGPPTDVMGFQEMILELRLVENHLSAVAKRSALTKIPAVGKFVSTLKSAVGDPSLSAVVLSTAESIPSILRAFPEVMEAMVDECVGPQKRKRKTFMRTVPSLWRFVPDLFPQLESRLQSYLETSTETIRADIARLVRDIHQLLPRHMKCMASLIYAGCAAEDQVPRQLALKSIVFALQSKDAPITSLIDCVRAGLRDDFCDVRKTAIQVTAEVMNFLPQYGSVLLEAAIPTLWDSYVDVSKTALSLVESMIRQDVSLLSLLLQTFEAAFAKAESDLRERLLEAAGNLLQLIPAAGLELSAIIVDAGQDQDVKTRSAAVQSMGYMTPDQSPALVSTLLAALDDTVYSVRKAAVTSLEKVVSYVTAEQLTQLCERLRALFKDEDFFVRCAAIETIGTVLLENPEQVEFFADAILAACDDDDYVVRKTMLEMLGNLVEHLPHELGRFLDVFQAGIRDSHAAVRKAALHNVLHAIGHSPDLLPGLVASLRLAIGSEKADVRKGCVEAICEMMKMEHLDTTELKDVLLLAFEDSDRRVLTSFLVSLEDAVGFDAEEIPTLMRRILDAGFQKDNAVRGAAMGRLRKLLHLYPSAHGPLLEALREACASKRKFMRSTAFNLLPDVLKYTPELMPEWIPVVRDGIADSEYPVRQGALLLIKIALKHNAAPLEELQALLFTALQDQNGRVRAAALEVMASALQAAPAAFPDFIPSIVASCTGQSFSEQSAAFRAIRMTVVQRQDLVAQFIEPLVVAAQRKTVQERMDSRIILQRVPLEMLVDFYWSSSLKACVAASVVPRFFRVPLTVMDSEKADFQKLTLHVSGSRCIEWEKPREEVQAFIELLRQKHQSFLTSAKAFVAQQSHQT